MNKKVSVIIPVFNQEELVLKSLDSIPTRDDIEIIIINDCSIDNTKNNIKKYISKSNKDIKYFDNEINRGVGFSVNKGYDNCCGEWIVLLGSDDYFYTDKLNSFIDEELDTKYDLIYFDLEDNNGVAWESNEKDACPGSVKFMKRSFLGDTRGPNLRVAEDWHLHNRLMEKNPKCKYTGKIIKHYNYPREGSLTWDRNNH